MPRTYITVDDNGKSNIEYDKATGRNKFKKSGDVFDSAEAAVLGNTDWDAINNPITAFNFVLEVELVYYLPLKSIRAFTKENEYEYIREGGVNDYVHMKRKPISKPFTFQIERYIGTERFLDPLATGTELVLPLILYLYRHKARSGFTDEAPAWPARIYIFTGCTVMGKEYGELNAEKSGLVTETTTIAYRELIVIPNPKQSGSERSEWDPEVDKYPSGVLKNKYAAVHPNDKVDSDIYDYKWSDEGDFKQLVRKKESPGYKEPNYLTKENKNNYNPKWVRDPELYTKDQTYSKDVDEFGNPTIKREIKDDYNKPANVLTKENYKDYKIKYAKQSTIDEAGATYTKDTDAKGISTIKRSDTGDYNRPQYEMATDKAKNKYAATSANDSKKPNQVGPYSISKDGTKNVAAKTSGKDSEKSKQVGPYSYKNDGTNNVAAAKSPTDSVKPVQVGPYQYKDGTKNVAAATSPTDQEKPKQIGPYEVNKDGTTNVAAAKSPKDSEKPEQRGPYEYKNGTTNVAAAVSPKDSEKPNQVGPYSYGNGTKNVAAAVSPRDSEKPQARGPYSIRNGTANTPGIAVSPTDKDRAPVTIYPPSRRALMADALKNP